MQKNLNHLSQELNNGNIEYKWKLINISDIKFHNLVTQMLYRLIQGNGYAEYYIGVKDNGNSDGISKIELNKTLYNIIQCCMKLDVKIISYIIYEQKDNKYCINFKLYKANLPTDKIII